MSRLLNVGRADTNEITLSDRTVSRHHGRLEILSDGRVQFRDMGSSGGSHFILDGELVSIDNIDLEKEDYLLLGGLEISVAQLLQYADANTLNARVKGVETVTDGVLHVEVSGRSNRRGDGQSRVRRDPDTGKIIRDE